MTNQNLSVPRLLALSLSIAVPAAAHGYVQGIVAEGQYYQGYKPSFQYQTSPPKVPGWSDPANINNGYISDYSSPDIICHLGATPGQAYATVEAGDTVTLQWTDWPIGHLGPVLTYMANCNGECTNVTKTGLLFNKIDAVGLVSSTTTPGTWGASELIANNNSWTVTIPAQIAPGNYVLRNEIIALQEAQTFGHAQNFPQCINLKVTGSGTNSLQSGTLGTQLYHSADPGLYIDIYQSLSNYTIPGPPLLSGLASNAAVPTTPFANTTTTVSPGIFVTTTSSSTSIRPTTFTTTTMSNTTSTTSSSTTSTSLSASTLSTMNTTTTRASSMTSTSDSTSTVTSSTTTASELLFAIQPAIITLDLVDGAAPTAASVTLNGTFSVNRTATSLTASRALVTGTGRTGTGYPFFNTTATSYGYFLPTLSASTRTTSDSSSTTPTATFSTSVSSTVLVFSTMPVTTVIEKRRHQRDFVQSPFVEVVEGDQRRRVY